MKIKIINGSPRKNGNSSFISEELEKYFMARGDQVEVVYLNGLNFKGCQGCLSCRKNGSFCVVVDDLQSKLRDFVDTDLFVLISPNYYGAITGQMKLFLDRWYCLKDQQRRSKLKEGAKAFFIVTQGSPNRDHGKSIIDWAKHIFEGFGCKYYGYVLPNCSTENLDMVKAKMKEISMHIGMFV
ncbi:MAG: flavodoxin family protein [Calditerrivibrio sp.]|nr:flavodoxin family protein [Calditerrivibrio sp.]